MSAILIVEDHITTAQALKSLLHRQGYHVEHVACGEAALDYLGQRLPGLMILDIGLSGINGLEVLKQVRANRRTEQLPVIVFSALADDSRKSELLQSGANECWLKAGTDASQIIDRVASYITPDAGMAA